VTVHDRLRGLPDDDAFLAALSRLVRQLDQGGAVFGGDTVDAVIRVVKCLRADPELAATVLRPDPPTAEETPVAEVDQAPPAGHLVPDGERMWCPMCWNYVSARADVEQGYCPYCRWPTQDLEEQIGYRTLLFERAAAGSPPRPVPAYTVAAMPDGGFVAQPATLEGFTPAGMALIAGNCRRRFTAAFPPGADGFADIRGPYLDGREGMEELVDAAAQVRLRTPEEARAAFARMCALADSDASVEPGSSAAAWRRMDPAAREAAARLVEMSIAGRDQPPNPQFPWILGSERVERAGGAGVDDDAG